MSKFRTYIVIASVLLVAHAAEEYMTKFYDIDSSVRFLAAQLAVTPLVALIMVHVVLTIFLLVLFFQSKDKLLLSILGLILLFEAHHIIESLLARGYYPGVITAVPIVMFTLFFWRKFIREVKTL